MNKIISSIKIILILSSSSILSQNSNKNYDSLLNSLNYNFTLDYVEGKYSEDVYFEPFNITKEEHLAKYDEYKKAVSDLLKSNRKILSYLVNYENNFSFCNWINTPHPHDSTIKDIIETKSEAAIVLIDYYLIGKLNRIQKPSYFSKLKYRKIKRFLRKNKSDPIEVLRIKYKEQFDCVR